MAFAVFIAIAHQVAEFNIAEELNHETARWRRSGYCGVNCLYAILTFLDVSVAYDDVADAVPADPQHGTSLEELRRSSSAFGVDLQVTKIAPKQIRDLEPPYIAHLESPDQGGAGHFVVVFFTQPEQICYVDGTSGLERAVRIEDFERLISGYLLVPAITDGEKPWFATIVWISAAVAAIAFSFAICRELLKQQPKAYGGR